MKKRLWHHLVRLIVASLFVPVLCTTLGGSSGAADAPEIRVGVSQDFRPYAFADKNGRPVGYSIDLIQAVARAMGLRVEIKAGTWDQVWQELAQGQIDVLAIVAKTPDRESQVDFSVPHTETFDAFFVRTGQPAIPNLAAAAGKEIVVRRSDAALKFLPRNYSGKLTLVDTIPQGLALVAAGQHDAFLTSKLIGTLEMRENYIQGLTAGPPIPDYKRVFAFAVRKGNPELLEKLNQGLSIVKASGEYDRIYRQWLAVAPDNRWQRWTPYFRWTVASAAVLAALAGFLQWLVRRRTRQLALANEVTRVERKRLFDVLETVPAMVCLLTPDYHVAFANRSFRERFGESNGRHCYEYCFGRTEPCDFCESYKPLTTGQPHHWEVTGPDGSVIAAHDFPFTDTDGSPLILEMDIDITKHRLAEVELKQHRHRLEELVQQRTAQLEITNAQLRGEITEHKQTEAALRESETKYRSLFEHMLDGFAYCQMVFNEHGQPEDFVYLAVNDAFRKITGMTDVIGKRVTQLIPGINELTPELFQIYGRVANSGNAERFEINFTPLGRYLSISVYSPAQGYFVAIFADVTERKQAEEALIRSEKLASVGQMAATIAHEINNPLEAVTNTLYLAQGTEGMPESARQYLEIADAELKRIAHITRQSLGFYRESTSPAPTSITAVLDSAVELLKSKIKAKHAVIDKQWDGDVQVIAVAGELRQVFSNLLVNSLDAINDKGTITLRVSSGTSANNGDHHLQITIADNGKGIDAGLRQRIFEPFFTTKGAVGTGLGLWISKQIIDKHSGKIQVRSSTSGPRRGTTVSILLPAKPAVCSRAAGA